ncbi:MAG: hypothetical protein MJ094_04250 [Saccharofermentans sp.]|nr:hypothetical protein [Saccharofermentans sp.]
MTSVIKKYNGKLVSEATFLAAFTCFLILKYLEGTTFTVDYPDAIPSLLRAIILSVGLYRLIQFRGAFSRFSLSVLGCLFGLGLFFLINRGDYFILDMSITMLGAIGVPFKRIGALYIYVAVFISLLAMVCSQTGLISDYVFYTDIGSNLVTRHSFGIIYPTDCFAHLFYISIVYFIVRWKRITYLEIGVIGVLAITLFYFTGARAGFVGSIFVVISILICKIFKYRRIVTNSKIQSLIGALVMPICAAFIILLTWFFNPNNTKYVKLDNMMTQRLSLGKAGFDLYGFSPLGKSYFAENGNANGGIIRYAYVFYDSSYIKTIFKYGVIVLLLAIIVYALISIKLAHSKSFYAVIFITAIAISCVIEHHIWELSYNISFLILTADMSSCLQSTPYIINNNKIMV